VARTAREVEEQRATEVRRRLASVRAELDANAKSLDELSGQITSDTKECPSSLSGILNFSRARGQRMRRSCPSSFLITS